VGPQGVGVSARRGLTRGGLARTPDGPEAADYRKRPNRPAL
jgi:hypothetical protein